MKEILNTVDKKSLILSIIYKISSYVCWYLFAVLMVVFINGTLNRNKLIILILSLFIVYTIRILFKYFYKKEVDDAYYSIKHQSEMYYFKKLEKIDPSELEHIDKNILGNKILEITYNITRFICDIFEYMVPLIIGIIIYFIILTRVNIFISLIVIAGLIALIYYEYKVYTPEPSSNYNDLLTDFVNKLCDIRMLNAFNFCYKKLDKSTSNICIIRNNIKYDLVYDLSMIALLFVSIISTIFLVKPTIEAVGISLFFMFMGVKLKKLIFQVIPTYMNYQEYKTNVEEINEYFVNTKNEKSISDFKKIVIQDAQYTYESGITIKISNFQFEHGDNISILGAAGMGKSTLLYILSGMYKLDKGDIIVDGNKTTSKIDSMYITRNTKMFKLSLRDNLLLGIRMPDEDILKLIDEIDLKEWYNSLVEGLDTVIDINYVDLPDDVREKLNILRGIISDKETLLLDEPTYDLDMDSEKIIANMIKKYWKKKNYIIVSHRPIFTTICKKHYFMKNHELLESEPLL